MFLNILFFTLSYFFFYQPNIVSSNTNLTLLEYQDRIIENSTKLSLKNLDFTDLALSSKENSNLYLILANQYAKKTNERAIKGVAALHGITETEAEMAIHQGKSPKQVPQSELLKTYEEEKALFETLASLEMETIAIEIFSNASTWDSNFDLINDLEAIEDILFKETSSSQFFKMNRDSSSAHSIASDGFAGSFGLSSPNSSFPNAELAQTSSSLTPDPSSPNNEQDTDPSTTQPQTPEPEKYDDICPIDPELAKQLQKFDSTQKTSSANTASASQNSNSPNNNQNIGQNTNNLEPGNTASAQSPINLGLPSTKTPFNPQNAECPNAIAHIPGFFCLRTEKIYKTATLKFPERKGACINCILDDLHVASENLTSKSLAPKKITGNSFEPAVCKEYSWNALSFNVNLIAKPARQDLKSVELLENLTIQERNIPTQLLDSEHELKEQSAEMIIGNQQTTRLTEIIDTREKIEAVISNLLESSKIDNLSNTQNELQFIQQLDGRVQTFSQNFATLKQSIQNIETSLTQVNNKNYCS